MNFSKNKTRITVNGTTIEVDGVASIVTRNGTIFVNGQTIGENLSGTVNLRVEGGLASVESDGDVTCGDVQGKVSAGGSVHCGNVAGSASAGGSVKVTGSVSGNASAGGSVKVYNGSNLSQ